MFSRLLLFVLTLLLLGGCKDLKDQQLDAYVGDSQTKIVYKNVGKNVGKVPKDRQVSFRSQSEAVDQGYTPENVAGDGGGGSEE
ncbi:MAG: hypothetical protein H7Y17_07350 [Chlorobia bacterium]|nr:hypothetical protein [Fimbriimonadaceae bacterium]